VNVLLYGNRIDSYGEGGEDGLPQQAASGSDNFNAVRTGVISASEAVGLVSLQGPSGDQPFLTDELKSQM